MVEGLGDSAEEAQAIAELVGTTLGERYQLERVLGTGGMGAVFEGKDLRLERPVAVKVMQPGYAGDAEHVRRFLREARAASKVRHRNVVVVLDYGEARGRLVYSVMELLAGQDLEQFLRKQPGQRLAWPQACGLLVQIASGLRAAHGQGVIHRDVKPANCFLTVEDDEPLVKLVDFGIAKLGEGTQTHQLTGTGNVLGTPSYTAPEMVLTGGPASPRMDVYSLGVVAYRMLAGRVPFTGSTAFEAMHRACIEPVPGLREQGVELPAGLEELVLEMLSKQPEERPADMSEVRRRLVTLAREAGGLLGVDATGSSSMTLDLVTAGASGSGVVKWTEELGSTAAAAEAAVAAVASDGAREERTVVVTRAGLHEPSRPSSTPWLVGGAVIVAALIGGAAWMLASGERATESVLRAREAGEVAVVEAPADAPQGEGDETKIAAPTLAAIVVEDGADDADALETLEPTSKADRPRGPTRSSSDAELKRRLVRRIKTRCAAELAGGRVTVVFDVTPSGEVKRLTAMPKDAAGECAKRQVSATRFRTRGRETNIEIEVG